MVHQILLALLVLGASVWIGGVATIAVVNSATKDALSRADRIALFRTLGRRFLVLAVIAVVLVVVAGGILLLSGPLGGITIAILIAVAVLAVATALGVVQARGMTRLRVAALASPDDEALRGRIARGTVRAGALRILIALASLAIFVLAFLPREL